MGLQRSDNGFGGGLASIPTATSGYWVGDSSIAHWDTAWHGLAGAITRSKGKRKGEETCGVARCGTICGTRRDGDQWIGIGTRGKGDR
jgi:hypothetical protein